LGILGGILHGRNIPPVSSAIEREIGIKRNISYEEKGISWIRRFLLFQLLIGQNVRKEKEYAAHTLAFRGSGESCSYLVVVWNCEFLVTLAGKTKTITIAVRFRLPEQSSSDATADSAASTRPVYFTPE
jgi:hypothetical protein